VAADDSAIGKFSAYLAGLIGGGSGMPTTFLHLTNSTAKRPAGAKGSEKHLETIRKGAKASATAVREGEDTPVDKVHLSARAESGATGKTIADEARKGYDMLVVGLSNSLTPKGDFTARMNDIASGFDGPLCLVVKGGGAVKMPALQAGETILVPVNGTEASRRAAELALALARPNRARVKALYVAREDKASSRKTSLSHRREEAVLKDIADLGERYGVSIVTAMRMQGAPGDAIRKEAARSIALVVMGVTQRPGDELFFGETAASVLGKSRVPVVLLSTGRVQRDDAEQEARRSSNPDESKESK
jgi:nucleotide-binding universal stress UspA family protein